MHDSEEQLNGCDAVRFDATASPHWDKTCDIIVEHLGVPKDTIEPDSGFVDNLGADSLDIIELVMAFEEGFNVEIRDDEAENITNVADVIVLLDSKAS
jgi:acyl carrier protein